MAKFKEQEKLRMVVDLHGLTVDEAISDVILAFEEAKEDEYDELEIITGIGEGILQTAVEEYLLDNELTYTISDNGASMVVEIENWF